MYHIAVIAPAMDATFSDLADEGEAEENDVAPLTADLLHDQPVERLAA